VVILSRKHLTDHVAVNVGEPPFDAVVVEGEPCVIEAEEV
jgi:hypothetical protein